MNGIEVADKSCSRCKKTFDIELFLNRNGDYGKTCQICRDRSEIQRHNKRDLYLLKTSEKYKKDNELLEKSEIQRRE